MSCPERHVFAHAAESRSQGRARHLVVFAGCAPKTATPVTQPAAARARLSPKNSCAAIFNRIFTDSAVDHAVWSVSVQSLKQGGTLYSLNPSRMQTPASNQKLITSAVAAERLGWDYRYTHEDLLDRTR